MTIEEIVKNQINIDWQPKIVYVSRNGVEVGVKRDIGDENALRRAFNVLIGGNDASGN